MRDELNCARNVVVQTCKAIEFTSPWAFEFTPSSSEPPDQGYLRKVREADFVFWLIGKETTKPVVDEITTCMAADRRLLAFKLPSETRCETTNKLMDQVATYAKWAEVKKVDDLAQHVRGALSDEFVRALRDPEPPGRALKLEDMKQLSISRCKSMWTSLSVQEEMATELAEDQTVGDSLEFPTSGVLRVEGDQGSGKTLAAERLFQRAVDRALEDSSQPFPIFVSARDLQKPIEEYVEQKSKSHFRASFQGSLIVIDGLDEIGVKAANLLLNGLSIFTDAQRKVTAVVTTRPLPGLKGDVGQCLSIPTLDKKVSFNLICRIAGRVLEPHETYAWSASVKDVIKRPLFAIMVGSVLRDSPDSTFHMPVQLVTDLADRALQEEEDAEEVDLLLQKLAVKAISSGKRIHPHDASPRRAKQKILADSRLVNEQEGLVDFTLPIFREWYAARALIEGTVSFEDIDSDSDLWIIPLAIAVDSENENFGYSLMVKLCSSDPGLASLVLREVDPGWSLKGMRDISLATAVEEGKKIREAMRSWGQGLGELYPFIGPTDSRGKTSTLGIEVDADSFGVTISWYRGTRKLPTVMEFSKPSDWASNNPEWSGFSYSSVQNTKLWPWLITKNHLAYSLSREGFLESLALNSESDAAVRELSWAFALDVEGKGDFYPYPIGIKGLLEFIGKVELWSKPVMFGLERTYPLIYVKKVKSHLLKLVESGEDSISDPWPIPEGSCSSGLIWVGYSSQTFLERTKVIYEAALRIYQTVVDRWFKAFRGRLVLYACQPVRLEGRLEWPPRNGQASLGPTLTWCPRPLSANESSSVAFVFGDANEIERNFHSNWKDESPFMKSGFLKVYDLLPATTMAIDWLSGDLRDLGWDR